MTIDDVLDYFTPEEEEELFAYMDSLFLGQLAESDKKEET